jgi:hypothetical protein
VYTADYSAEGVATIVFPATTAAGTYPVTISYPGDNNYNTVPTTPISVTIASSALLPTIITATASAPTTSLLASISIAGSVSGPTGTVPPTGTVSISDSGVSFGSPALYVSTGATGTSTPFTLLYNTELLSQGANLITLTYSGDKNYQPSTTTISLLNPLSDFNLTPQSPTVSVLAGSKVTDAVYISSTNGFAGKVSLACTAAPGVTCTPSPSSVTLTSGGAATATLTIAAPAATAAGKYI